IARVRGEAFSEMLGRASNLEVFGEPFGELFGRERLVLEAFGILVDRWGERAALEEDEGGGRAGEVRIALQAVRGVGPAGEQGRGDQLPPWDLEDLQFVLEDQGQQPLVRSGVDVEFDGEVRERASEGFRGHLASEWSGSTEERWLYSAPVSRARTASTTRPSATTTPLASPSSSPSASERPTPASLRTYGSRALLRALVAVTGTAAGTFL